LASPDPCAIIEPNRIGSFAVFGPFYPTTSEIQSAIGDDRMKKSRGKPRLDTPES
jgi:hypothetical protein